MTFSSCNFLFVKDAKHMDLQKQLKKTPSDCYSMADSSHLGKKSPKTWIAIKAWPDWGRTR